jgi:hypothetical protein
MSSLSEFGSLPSAQRFAECLLSGTRQKSLCLVSPSAKEDSFGKASLPSAVALVLDKETDKGAR